MRKNQTEVVHLPHYQESIQRLFYNHQLNIAKVISPLNVLLRAGLIEVVVEEPSERVIEPSNTEVNRVQGEADSTVDAPLSQTNHSDVTASNTTNLPTEDAGNSEETNGKGDLGDAPSNADKADSTGEETKKKSKRGPRRYPMDRILKTVDTWVNLDRDQHAITLEEFLEEEFGTTPDGRLNVSRSTFYYWINTYWKPSNKEQDT